MQYKIISDSIKFERIEEKNNSALIIIHPSKHQIVLNKTGQQILKMLPNYELVNDVLNELIKIYPNTDERILKNDLDEILALMDLYDIINLTDCLGENISNEIEYKITGDVNYKIVGNFINKYICVPNSIKFLANENKEYYTPLSLRLRFVSNYEYGVFVYENKEVQSYLSLSLHQSSKVINVTSFIAKPETDDDKIIIYLNGMLRRFIQVVSNKEISKIRFNFYETENSKILINLLLKNNFILESTLRNETLFGDMHMYTYFL